jgi:hypothetical protein
MLYEGEVSRHRRDARYSILLLTGGAEGVFCFGSINGLCNVTGFGGVTGLCNVTGFCNVAGLCSVTGFCNVTGFGGANTFNGGCTFGFDCVGSFSQPRSVRNSPSWQGAGAVLVGVGVVVAPLCTVPSAGVKPAWGGATCCGTGPCICTFVLLSD